LLAAVEKQACHDRTTGIDHDEVTRRLAVRRLDVLARGLAAKTVVHAAMVPRLLRQVFVFNP